MKVGIRDELILRLQIPRVIPHPVLHIVLLHTVVVAAIVLIQVAVAVVVVVVEVPVHPVVVAVAEAVGNLLFCI
jgi:hypothetical protein